MSQLKPGSVNENHFNYLLDCTRIEGTAIVSALYDHLVMGLGKAEAYRKHGVNVSQFSRRLKTVHQVSEIVEKMVPYYANEEQQS